MISKDKLQEIMCDKELTDSLERASFIHGFRTAENILKGEAMKTNFQRTAEWLKECGREVKNEKHVSVQIGVDAEEIAEWFDCLRVSSDDWDAVRLRIISDLESLGNALKSGKVIGHVPVHLRVSALDALCDRDVTGNGVAYLLGMDKDGGDQKVLRSNESKFDENGKAIIAPTGKIMKSDRYVAPNLKAFI